MQGQMVIYVVRPCSPSPPRQVASNGNMLVHDTLTMPSTRASDAVEHYDRTVDILLGYSMALRAVEVFQS